MKRVLAILLFVPFVMALAPPCHAAELQQWHAKHEMQVRKSKEILPTT